MNNTEELEARVTDLEETVADLEVDINNVESVNILQEQTPNILELDLLDNDEDLEGQAKAAFEKNIISQFIYLKSPNIKSHIFPNDSLLYFYRSN